MTGTSKPMGHVYEAQLTVLGRFLQALQEGTTVREIVDATLQYLKTEFTADLIWLGLYERRSQQVLGQGGFLPVPDSQFLNQRLALEPGDLLEQVVVQRIPIGVMNLGTEARSLELRKAAQRFKIQGSALLPIRHRDRCWGILILGWHQWGATLQPDEMPRLSIALKQLGAALTQQEQADQHEKAKQPDQPLVHLLAKLRSLATLTQRFNAVATETQSFIAPSRTAVYWLDPKHHVFELQLSLPQKGNRGASTEIPVNEIYRLYQLLTQDQLIATDDPPLPPNVEADWRFFLKERVRALMIAPILIQQDLKGFLVVDNDQPRPWQNAEKVFLQGAAHLIALTAPLAETEAIVQRVKTQQAMLMELIQSFTRREDWQTTLRNLSLQLFSFLQIEQFVLLSFNVEFDRFDVVYHNSSTTRRTLPASLPVLNRLDYDELLASKSTPLKIDHWSDDLRLLDWRAILLDLGLRSLALHPITVGSTLDGVVIVAQDSPRIWLQAELDLIRQLGQHLGLLIYQRQLQQQNEQQQQLMQAIQWGLTSLQQIQKLDQLQTSAVQLIAQALQAPLTLLVTWLPGNEGGTLSASYSTDQHLSVAVGREINIHSDDLIQQVLLSDGLLRLSVDQLTATTQEWIPVTGVGQLLAIALRTAPEHDPTGVLIVADYWNHTWSERYLSALGTLVSQMAWARRYLLLTGQQHQQYQSLERLNWYKLQKLEEYCQVLKTCAARLQENYAAISAEVPAQGLANILRQRRYQDALNQFGNTVEAMVTLKQENAWQIHPSNGTLLLTTLLKRSLESVDWLFKEHQIWAQLHNLPEGASVNLSRLRVKGDIVRLELVIRELLSFACQRSHPRARIDLWPRILDVNHLELSITDEGRLDFYLLEGLSVGRSADLLFPSLLDEYPGLHLRICQYFIQQIKGELSFYQLEDGRTLTRLVLPVHEDLDSVQN